MSFAVVGCGIVGLTTALELQASYRNARVTIIADRFNEDTTSYVAAGIFRPGTGFMASSHELTRQCIADAFNYWDALRRSHEAPLFGICQLSGYIFSAISSSIVRNPFLEKILPMYRRATDEELHLCHGPWKYGSFFTTCLIESQIFLPYAMRTFSSNGGNVIHQRVSSFNNIDHGFDVIVNCTGLGAKELCNDQQLVPIRGQVLKLKAPWIKTAFYAETDTYVIPGFETVTLGGCRQYDNYNVKPCKYDTMSIKDRCFGMLPSLKNAEIVKELVGLRPYRPIVRLEKELLTQPSGKSLKIVHNYGHGGYGVTTAPGTAKYALKLVRELWLGNSKL